MYKKTNNKYVVFGEDNDEAAFAATSKIKAIAMATSWLKDSTVTHAYIVKLKDIKHLTIEIKEE